MNAGPKKRKSVDVIPVRVGQHQNAFLHAITGKFLAQVANTRSRVQDDAVVASEYL